MRLVSVHLCITQDAANARCEQSHGVDAQST